jgi:hypothetical protein
LNRKRLYNKHIIISCQSVTPAGEYAILTFPSAVQDIKALSSLRKLKKLEIICEKGCTAIVLKSESLVDLELIVASSDLRKVHLSAPLLTKLDLLNRSAPRLRVDDLNLALGQITVRLWLS